MKNRYSLLITLKAPVVTGALIIGLLISGATISCYTSAPTTPGPALPEAPTNETPVPPQTEVMEVTIEGFAFNPPTLNIAAGTTVVWNNRDTVPHTVTAGDGSFNSNNLPSGRTFRHTFTQTGTYQYHCAIHPYMEGTIVVD